MDTTDTSQDLRTWALTMGSGSLKQAVEWGMSWVDQARHERLAMEVASAAIFVRPSRITLGQFRAEGDCRVTTELGWYARTLQHRFAEHKRFSIPSPGCGEPPRVEVYYFTLSEEGCPSREGAGFILHNLILDWAPKGSQILIPLAYWDVKLQTWGPTENPL
jgi:hypothetical protein